MKDVLIPALRHRIMLNFEGEADGMTTDSVVEAIIAQVPTAVDDVPGVK